jgi:hypothetical protein
MKSQSIPSDKKMRLTLLQILAFLLVPSLYAGEQIQAEQLLIMEVYARIVSIGQAMPIPDPFVEAIVQGQAPIVGEGLHALQGKSFRISSKFQDFAATVVGVDGEKVSIQFSAAVLPNGGCAVIQYRAMALANRLNGQTSFIGFSETVNRGGFTVLAGTRIAQSVSAQSGSGRVVYYLIFSALRGSRE